MLFGDISSCENSAPLSHHLIDDDDGHYSKVIGGSGFFRRRPTHVSILLIEWELILLVQTPKRRFMGKSTPARAANKTWPRSLLIRGSAYTYYLCSYTMSLDGIIEATKRLNSSIWSWPQQPSRNSVETNSSYEPSNPTTTPLPKNCLHLN